MAFNMDVESYLKDNAEFDRECHSVLRSWDFDKADAAHEGRVALFFLAKKGYNIDRPIGLVRVALVNAQRDKYKSLPSRAERCSQDINELISGQGFCDNRRQMNIDSFLSLISDLSNQNQELLIMKYIFGLEEQELADHFGLARGTVKSRTSRAINFLRKSHDLSGSSSINNFELTL